MERLSYVDSLKGIGILLVVMGHLLSPGELYLQSTVKQFVYSFHMPLFFFLSGLVYGLSRLSNSKVFLAKKITSLLIPYLSFTALYAFVRSVSWIEILSTEEVHKGYWFSVALFFVFIVNFVTDSFTSKLGGGNFCLN